MARLVYIETSVPSAYVTTRADPGSVSRKEQTRLWWSHQRENYQVYISEPVVLELEQGSWPGQEQARSLVAELPRLRIDEEVIGVARRYVEEHLVPKDLGGDAVHLAAACVHGVDFLLTWNIRHLANPNKTDHLTVVNRKLGLLTPQIVTPEALWLEEEE